MCCVLIPSGFVDRQRHQQMLRFAKDDRVGGEGAVRTTAGPSTARITMVL